MPFFTVVLNLVSRDVCPISYAEREYRNQRDRSPNAIDVGRFAPQSFSSLTAGLDSMKLRSTLWPSSSLILLTPYLFSQYTFKDIEAR